MSAPTRNSSEAGFTFVEILIALFITALLAGTACRALVAVLDAERRSTRLSEAALHVQTVACRAYLDLPGGVGRPAGEWTADPDDPPAGAGPVRWRVWRIHPQDRPFPQGSVEIRAADRPWR